MDRDLETEYDGRDLPEGWVVWSEDEGVVICYRPDVFNAEDYPRRCLPLVTVVEADTGSIGGRTGWRVSLFVEVDVEAHTVGRVLPDYDAAVDYMVEVAEEFNAGDFDLRGFYAEEDVRDDYIERIEEEID
ncbi:MAG: DUF5820 family protein [Halobacteria archaeon]|nr:DUF5820 family protein [Halobacteria archaeon]